MVKTILFKCVGRTSNKDSGFNMLISDGLLNICNPGTNTYIHIGTFNKRDGREVTMAALWKVGSGW